MKEFIARGVSLPQAYHYALWQLHEAGEITECGDWNTRQKECAMTLYVKQPLEEPMISRMIPCGPRELQQYLMEMLDGILDFEVDKGNWNYTYHRRMVKPKDQIQFVIDELKRNPSSRRAVICIRTPEDMGSPDPACMQHIQYMIRNDRLDCSVLFRSNDAVKATFMNAFALIWLQDRIADELGVECGTYTHRANSFHAYEKDWDLLRSYHDRINIGNDAGIFYDGEWKEMMEDEIEGIEKGVKILCQR